MLLINYYSQNDRGEFYDIVHNLLIFHVGSFVLQVSYYVVFDDYLNLSDFVRFDEADTLHMSKALENMSLGVRFTGFFTEPSFYSMLVLPISFLILKISPKSKVAFFGIFTSLLSLSVASIIIAIFSVLFLNIRKVSFIKLTWSIAFLLFILVFSYDFIIERVVYSSDYDAISSRSYIFYEIMKRGLYEQVLGYGIFFDSSKTHGYYMLEGYHIRDSSFYVYVLYTVGLMGMFFFITSLLYLIKVDWLFVLPFFLFKYHVLSSVFYIVIFVFFLCKLIIESESYVFDRRPMCD
nr:hypothetical protein BCU42_20235 [Vibrio splendidus]